MNFSHIASKKNTDNKFDSFYISLAAAI